MELGLFVYSLDKDLQRGQVDVLQGHEVNMGIHDLQLAENVLEPFVRHGNRFIRIPIWRLLSESAHAIQLARAVVLRFDAFVAQASGDA